jgi:hypothetical protein
MLKIRYLYTLGQHTGVNVFHVSFTGTIADQSAMTAILTQLATLTQTNIRPLINIVTSLNTIEATDLSSRTGVVASTAGFGAGTMTGGANLPDNVAACVSLPVLYRYRGGHPRLYLPGQQSLNVTGTATWTGGWVTTVQNAMIAWRNAINNMTGANAPFVLSMVSYFTHDANRNPIYHPGGPQPYPIAGVRLHTRIDTQRRRLGREV